MKRFCFIPVLLVLAVGAFAGDLRHDWAQKYNSIAKLFNNRDIQGIQQLLADNFVLIDEHGARHNKADVMKHEYEPLGLANLVDSDVSVSSVRVRSGNVDVAYDMRYYVVYDDPKSGHSKMHGREIGVDTWRKFGKNWLIVQTRVKSAMESKVSGK